MYDVHCTNGQTRTHTAYAMMHYATYDRVCFSSLTQLHTKYKCRYAHKFMTEMIEVHVAGDVHVPVVLKSFLFQLQCLTIALYTGSL